MAQGLGRRIRRRVALIYSDAPVEYRRSLVHTARFEYFSDLGG